MHTRLCSEVNMTDLSLTQRPNKPGRSHWEMGSSRIWGPARSEFNPYRDYLGLAQLVTTMTCQAQDHQDLASDEEDVLSEFRNNGRDFGLMPFRVEAVDHGGRRGRLLGLAGKAHSRCAPTWCVFCKNNGESEMVFASHVLKDDVGKITCPILRAYTCPLCGQSGDFAHTIKYCPTTKGEVPPAPLKTARTSTGRKRTVTQSSQTSINELFM